VESVLIFLAGMAAFCFGLSPEFIAFQTRFAVFAQNMLRDGPSWFPTLYGRPYGDYPGLPTFFIWLIARVVGRVTPLAAVLPTAIASSLILVITYWIGALRSRRWGIAAALMLLLTYGFVFSARSISPDQFTALAAVGCFYACYSADELKRRGRLWWVVGLLVFGFACRGPIGLVVPAAVVGTYYAVRGEWRMLAIASCVMAAVAGVCVAGLLWAALHQGGKEFVRDVIKLQAAGRVGEGLARSRSSSALEYWFGCLGTYALSYPIAVLVVIGYWRKVVRREGADGLLLACLAAWVVVVLAGMSIPSKKAVRYVLPIAPAAALMAAYVVLAVDAGEVVRRGREALLRMCRVVPIVGAIGAVVVYVVRGRSTPALEGPFLLTAGGLAAVAMVGEWLRFRTADRDVLTLATGAVAFVFVMAGVVEPAVFSRERAGPLVAKIEAMRRERPGPLAFYWAGPDQAEMKFVVNLERPETPEFVFTTDRLLAAGGAYFVAREEMYRIIPSEVRGQFEERARGWIGGDEWIVFTRRGV